MIQAHNIYEGNRSQAITPNSNGVSIGNRLEVKCNGELLDPAHYVRKHTIGFEWGYAGAGPSQLALAILVREFGQDSAIKLYHKFKREIIAYLPEEHWTLTSEDIRLWCMKNLLKLCSLP